MSGGCAAVAAVDHFSDPPPASTVTLNILWTGSVLQFTVLIYAYAGGAAHIRRRRARWRRGGNDNVESCTLSFRGSLKPFFVIGLIYLCCCLFVFTCCVEVSCPTPRYSLSLSSSLSAVHLCANVCARFMAPKDKEKQSLVCSAAPRPCE